MLYYILGIITGLLIAFVRKKDIKEHWDMITHPIIYSKAQFIDPISDEEKIMQPFNE